MKKRIYNIAFALSLLILSSIVLQSVHAVKHLNHFLSEKKCNHHYAINKTVISHQHHQADHCFSCEFTFSNYVNQKFTCFQFFKVESLYRYNTFFSNEITQYFKGSLFQLRAPPSYIV